jgi:hypothetical protein
MDIMELVQKSVDEWNKKNKEAFLTHFTERSEITGPDGAALHGLQGSRDNVVNNAASSAAIMPIAALPGRSRTTRGRHRRQSATG